MEIDSGFVPDMWLFCSSPEFQVIDLDVNAMSVEPSQPVYHPGPGPRYDPYASFDDRLMIPFKSERKHRSGRQYAGY